MIAAAIVLALLVALGYVVARNPYFRWSIFGEYFFSAPILDGIRMTLILTAVTMHLGVELELDAVPVRDRHAAHAEHEGAPLDSRHGGEHTLSER